MEIPGERWPQASSSSSQCPSSLTKKRAVVVSPASLHSGEVTVLYGCCISPRTLQFGIASTKVSLLRNSGYYPGADRLPYPWPSESPNGVAETRRLRIPLSPELPNGRQLVTSPYLHETREPMLRLFLRDTHHSDGRGTSEWYMSSSAAR
jgi:hypothetical protein